MSKTIEEAQARPEMLRAELSAPLTGRLSHAAPQESASLLMTPMAAPAPLRRSCCADDDAGSAARSGDARMLRDISRFFELGGQPLPATHVLARISDSLHLHLALPDVFDTPTIRGLAQRALGALLPASDPSRVTAAEEREEIEP